MLNIDNILNNWNYLIRITNPSYQDTPNDFKEHLKTPLDFSYATLDAISRFRKCTNTTLYKMNNYFQSCLKESSSNRIIDLNENPQKIKETFKQEDFNQYFWEIEKKYQKKRFIKKLYRCYYMAPNSPDSAYIAFLKIFNETEACMIKGIRMDDNLKNIQNALLGPDNACYSCKDFNSMKKTYTDYLTNLQEHLPEKLHFYKAEKIDFDKDCIRIDFVSEETSPCRTSIFWNVSIVNQLNVTPYIGGSALAIDTNQGSRGKDICSYKMGIEALENSTLKIDELKNPFDCSSVELIHELSITPKNGIFTIDNADDNRFFRFITEKYHRIPDIEDVDKKNKKMYSDRDVVNIMKEVLKSRDTLQKQIDELQDFTKIVMQKQINELQDFTKAVDEIKSFLPIIQELKNK